MAMPPTKHRGSFRTSTFVAGYALVFVFLALAGYYASDNAMLDKINPFTKHKFVSDMRYYPLPRMNLAMAASTSSRDAGALPSRLRMEIVLEVAAKDLNVVSGYQPKITERINSYMQRLAPEDLERQNSVVWLRAALLQQVNKVGSPAPIHDLYFQQFVMM